MKLRLLGPFELEMSKQALMLPGRGERALCALLGLSAGRVVAASSLVEALWSEEQLPRDPLNALQLRVSKLRRALATAGGPDRLSRVSAGCRLAIDQGDVDVHCFTDVVARARRTGDPTAAVELYDEALALWRADPLVDFAGERWAEVEVARLTELRLAALAERAERMLTLGRYEQLVGDLEPMVGQFPLRERLVGQLMTALFNAGRQAEALEVYERTRSALVEELGLDPTRELRTTMEQILRQDAAITVDRRPLPEPTPSRPEAGVPGAGVGGNLPLRVTSFVGRVPHAVADAVGIGIEGGTASLKPLDVLLSRLASLQLLLVLDNCEHVIDAVASVVEAMLARCPEVRIVTTSREALAVPGEAQLPVQPLPVPEPSRPAGEVPSFPAARLPRSGGGGGARFSQRAR